jgi:ferric-dicitrate binding protein FerR (iron transport regulator)
MDYSNFSIENFIMDEKFQEWVKYPTIENNFFWENWLRLNPHKEKEVKQARLIILSLDFKKSAGKDIPIELLLKKIQSSIHEKNHINSSSSLRNITFYYKVAAVFIGLLVLTVSLFLIINPPPEKYTTTYGEIKHLTLTDGSNVVLNANSSIQYNSNWEIGEVREVWLHGEAFFSISHKNDNQKFLVRTGHVNVEVLGTQFNVNTRRNNTKVVLNSGKVKLAHKDLNNEEIFMNPGELVEFSGGYKKITKKIVNPDQFTSWKTNQLIFKATPLRDIAQVLEDNYGWNIIFEEENIKNYEFTGTVSTESNDNVKLLFFTISEAFYIDIQEENNQIIFKYKK